MRRDFPEQRQERTEPADDAVVASRRSAWRTALRVLLTAVLCVLLVGFGVCGAYGTVNGLAVGVSQNREAGLFLMAFGVSGLAIGWLCWRALARLWRTPSSPPSNT
jgi:hypothetical protein